MHTRTTFLFVVAAAVAAAVAAPPPAAACINGSRFSQDEAVREVARAERLIAAGRYRQALRLLESHDILYHRYRGYDRELNRHALLLIATARLRQARYPRDLTDALRTFEALAAKDGTDDPLLLARVAEAQARTADPADDEAALATLTELADADLIPDAEAYAALSKLRLAADDHAGAADARARCRKLTRRARACGPAVKVPAALAS